MSQRNGISQWRQAGPFTALMVGTLMSRSFVSGCAPSQPDAVDPLDGRTRREGRGAKIGPWSGELAARAGDDHHAVAVDGADVLERLD
jgi:hypothetical protein